MKLILYIVSGLPYAYISMLGDALWGTMVFYLLSAVVLFFVWRRLGWRSMAGSLAGGILSVLLSAWAMPQQYKAYFKPFSPVELAIGIGILALSALTLACIISSRSKRG